MCRIRMRLYILVFIKCTSGFILIQIKSKIIAPGQHILVLNIEGERCLLVICRFMIGALSTLHIDSWCPYFYVLSCKQSNDSDPY